MYLHGLWDKRKLQHRAYDNEEKRSLEISLRTRFSKSHKSWIFRWSYNYIKGWSDRYAWALCCSRECLNYHSMKTSLPRWKIFSFVVARGRFVRDAFPSTYLGFTVSDDTSLRQMDKPVSRFHKVTRRQSRGGRTSYCPSLDKRNRSEIKVVWRQMHMASKAKRMTRCEINGSLRKSHFCVLHIICTYSSEVESEKPETHSTVSRILISGRQSYLR